jgi:hypothetical protein
VILSSLYLTDGRLVYTLDVSHHLGVKNRM